MCWHAAYPTLCQDGFRAASCCLAASELMIRSLLAIYWLLRTSQHSASRVCSMLAPCIVWQPCAAK